MAVIYATHLSNFYGGLSCSFLDPWSYWRFFSSPLGSNRKSAGNPNSSRMHLDLVISGCDNARLEVAILYTKPRFGLPLLLALLLSATGWPLAMYKFDVAVHYFHNPAILSRVNFLGMSSSTTPTSAVPAESSNFRTQTDLQAVEMAAIYWIDNLTPHELCRRIRAALTRATLLPNETGHLWSLLRRSDGSFDYREDFRNCEPTIVYSRISRRIHSRELSWDEITQLLLILPKMCFNLERIINTIADDTPRHCARCHCDYRERVNNLRACRLRAHDIPDIVSVEGRTLPCYKYDCCRTTFTRELPAGPCIRRHFVGPPQNFGRCLARGCT